MFSKLKKGVEALLKDLGSVITGKNGSSAGDDGNGKKKTKKKGPQKREVKLRTSDQRRPSDRTSVGKRERRPSNRKNEPAAKEKIQQKKTAVKEKEVPPVPSELAVPPAEEGKTRFFDLDLAKEILAATSDLEFKYCTEIQAKCLPHAIAGRDLAAKAQTGTGKTAAFLASTMTNLLRRPPRTTKPGTCRVLVLAPTRELAIQIHSDAEELAKYTHLYNLVIFGGMDYREQQEALQRPVDVLAGTPGRIIDYIRSGHLDLSRTEVLVIDEADRMLDMGFIPDVRRIVGKLPPAGTRQTMLFSATLEPEILRLADSFLRNPVSVEAEPDHVVTDLIDQRFYAVLSEQKLPFLLKIIEREKPERMIVFGNWKERNIELASQLYSYGIDVELLSGDIAQQKRLAILDRFRAGTTKVLVATDVAARGIHVDGISHVVNYDLPDQPDDYVHRIGRTGRAGAKGTSISFVCELGAFALPAIEEYLKTKVKTIQPDEADFVLPEKVRKAPAVRHSSDRGGRGGNRSHTGGRGGHGSSSFRGRRH